MTSGSPQQQSHRPTIDISGIQLLAPCFPTVHQMTSCAPRAEVSTLQLGIIFPSTIEVGAVCASATSSSTPVQPANSAYAPNLADHTGQSSLRPENNSSGTLKSAPTSCCIRALVVSVIPESLTGPFAGIPAPVLFLNRTTNAPLAS